MNTSSAAIQRLQQAQALAREATAIISDLIAPHDYQDVAVIVAQAAEALLEAAAHLMQSQDEDAFAAIERADDHLDALYAIIDAELDDE
jgi:Na+/phosphate symporter